MKFDILKTRHGKLADKIKKELAKPTPSLDQILEIVHDYENNNLNTIEKLKKEKLIEGRQISGAIKQFLHAHPVLTKELIGSLTKRIQGAILSNQNINDSYIKIRKNRFNFIVVIIILIIIGCLFL